MVLCYQSGELANIQPLTGQKLQNKLTWTKNTAPELLNGDEFSKYSRANNEKRLYYSGKSRKARVSSPERVNGSFVTIDIIQNTSGWFKMQRQAISGTDSSGMEAGQGVEWNFTWWKSPGPSIPVVENVCAQQKSIWPLYQGEKQSKSNKTKSRVAIMILSNRFMANIYKP